MENDNKSTLAASLSRLRAARGLTQEEAAAKIGVSGKTISKWERGDSTPDAELLPTISAALGTTPNGLFGMEEKRL